LDILLSTLGRLVLLAALLGGALFVFSRTRSDYRAYGHLSRPVAFFQVGSFCAYALASYAFLDSRLSQVDVRSVLFAVAVMFMSLGLLTVFFFHAIPWQALIRTGNRLPPH